MDLAILSYRKAIKISPGTAYCYRNLACVLAQQKKLDEVIIACSQAIKLNSKNPNFYNTLGDIQLQKGDVTHALKTYQQAIKLKPAKMKQIFDQLGDFIQKKLDETAEHNLSKLEIARAK